MALYRKERYYINESCGLICCRCSRERDLCKTPNVSNGKRVCQHGFSSNLHIPRASVALGKRQVLDALLAGEEACQSSKRGGLAIRHIFVRVCEMHDQQNIQFSLHARYTVSDLKSFPGSWQTPVFECIESKAVRASCS